MDNNEINLNHKFKTIDSIDNNKNNLNQNKEDDFLHNRNGINLNLKDESEDKTAGRKTLNFRLIGDQGNT